MKKVFSTLILAFVFNSFTLKTNCFEAKNIDFATGAEVGFAALKFPLAVAKTICELKDEDKNALILDLAYVIADLSDSGMKIYKDDNKTSVLPYIIYDIYNVIKLVKDISGIYKFKPAIKIRKIKHLKNIESKKILLSLIKNSALLGDSIFSVKFALEGAPKTYEEEYCKFSRSLLGVGFKVFANSINVNNRNNLIKPMLASLILAIVSSNYSNVNEVAKVYKQSAMPIDRSLGFARFFNNFSYYDVLGVSKDANKEEIQKAYRDLAMRFHPDRCKDEAERAEFNELFKILSRATDVLLKDDDKKVLYDNFLKTRMVPTAPQFLSDFLINEIDADNIKRKISEDRFELVSDVD